LCAPTWKVRTIPSHPNKRQALFACKAIEKEHRPLIHLINDMWSTIDAGETDLPMQSLRDFPCKVKARFRHEEEIARLHRHPHSRNHESQHNDLVRTLENGIGKNPAGEPVKVFLQGFNRLAEEPRSGVIADLNPTTYLRGL
jgi:hemerythrin